MGARPGNVSQEQLFDTHPESSLELDIVRESARQKYEKPFVILDTEIVREKARRFRVAMPRVRPHYAIKANPDPRVIEALRHEGAGCEIASSAELDLLTGLGVPAAELYY
jgi:ornithine decarboxylase